MRRLLAFGPALLTNLRLLLTSPKTELERLESLALGAQRYDLLREVFIEQPYRWLYAGLRPDTTVVDIGAYVGETAVYFAAHPNVVRVIAFEPVPMNFREARHNVALSPDREKIEVRNEALLAVGGERLVREDYAYGSIQSAHSRVDHRVGRMVRAGTLTQAIAGLTTVAIKCDIEGDEASLFDGDLANVYAIQIEYHGAADTLAETLRAHGFEITIEPRPNRPDRGLICALRPPAG